VTLASGEEAAFELPSAAAGGYRWTAAVDDPTIAEATIEFGEARPGPTGRAAFAEHERVTLHARAIGTTRVHCLQRRSWESGVAPLSERVITVDVVGRKGD
jgi:hypothetical protein